MQLKSVANGNIARPVIGSPNQAMAHDIVDEVEDRYKRISPRPRSRSKKIKRATGAKVHVDENNLVGTVRQQQRQLEHLLNVNCNFQEEIDHIGQTLETILEQGAPVQEARSNDALSLDDVQMLMDNMHNINVKLGEMDSLKLEVKLMSSKIKRLEEELRIAKQPAFPQDAHLATPHRKRTFDHSSQYQALNQVYGLHTYASSTEHYEPAFSSYELPRSASQSHHNGPYYTNASFQPIDAYQQPPLQIVSHGSRDDRIESHSVTEDDQPELDPRFKRPRMAETHTPSPADQGAAAFTPEYPSPPTVRQPNTSAQCPAPVANMRSVSTSSFEEVNDPSTTRSSEPRLRKTKTKSLWAPEGRSHGIRNRRIRLTRDGRVDGRTLNYKGSGHYASEGPRDAKGYLLRADGQRDKRSVRIIDRHIVKRQKERIEEAAAAAAQTANTPVEGIFPPAEVEQDAGEEATRVAAAAETTPLEVVHQAPAQTSQEAIDRANANMESAMRGVFGPSLDVAKEAST